MEHSSKNNAEKTAHFRRLPGFKVLLKESWEQFKINWWTYIALFLFPLVIMIIFGIIAVISGLGLEAFVSESFDKTALTPLMIALFAFFYIAMFVVQTWSYVALFYVAVNDKKKVGVGAAIKAVKKYFWPMVWLWILFTLIYYGGIVLFGIPSLIATMFAIFSIFIIVKDEGRGLNSIYKSHALVKGYWWGLVGRMFLLGLVIMVVLSAVAIVAVLLGAILSFVIFFPIVIALIGVLAFIAVMLLSYPIMLLFLYRIYVALTKIKSGQKLEASSRAQLIYKFMTVLGLIVSILYFAAVFLIPFLSGDFQAPPL